jgi:hypothetical protein
MQNVNVTIRIEINGETKEFRAAGTTSGNETRLAGGLMDGLTGDARGWLIDKRLDGADH